MRSTTIVRSFEQAQDMVRRSGGTPQLIAAYQQCPLPLDSAKIMHRRLVDVAADTRNIPTFYNPGGGPAEAGNQ